MLSIQAAAAEARARARLRKQPLWRDIVDSGPRRESSIAVSIGVGLALFLIVCAILPPNLWHQVCALLPPGAVNTTCYMLPRDPRLHVASLGVALGMTWLWHHGVMNHWVHRIVTWGWGPFFVLLVVGPWTAELGFLCFIFALFFRLFVWPSLVPYYMALRARLLPRLRTYLY